MFLRLIITLVFYGLLNFFVGHDIVIRWPLAQRHISLAWIIGILFFILQLSGPFGDRLGFARFKANNALGFFVKILTWTSYLALGAMSCLIVYSLVADLATLLWFYIMPPTNHINFYRNILIGLSGATFITTVIGIWQVWAGPCVKRVEILLDNLPLSFEGFTIAQISDLHIGPTIGQRYVGKIVRITNGLKPDLIALTGDFIDGTVQDLKPQIVPLASLAAPFGKYFVTGNHEYYWDAKAWVTEQEKLGAKVLNNEYVVLEKDGQSIILAGVPDLSISMTDPGKASDPQKALNGAPTGLIKILLAHQPNSYLKAEAAGFDLQLSGHTHGGQYFPFTLFIGFFQRYYKGLNHYKNLWIYVSRGTGYWGPPLRAGAPAEVTLLTLRCRK